MKCKDINREMVKKIIMDYAEAWITQDPEKIVLIFTPDGIYHEFVLEKPHVGHDAIKKYWQERVVSEESDIKFELLNLYIDGNVAIAEWDVKLRYKDRQTHMREVAILEIHGNKIKSLREYWHSS